MIQRLLDDRSERAGERYVAFLMSLRGVLSASLSTRPDDQRAFDSIRAGAYAMSSTFLDQEVERFWVDMEDAQDVAGALAQSDVLGDQKTAQSGLVDFSDELATWFRQELRAQIERDVNVLVAKRRELVLQATITTRTKGLDLMTAYLDLIRQGREKVDFYFTDRGGRRYPSQKFARQLYRHGLLTFAVETYSLEAASLGVKVVEITTADTSNSFNGKLYALGSDDSLPMLGEDRDDIFHPNSNNFIRAYS